MTSAALCATAIAGTSNLYAFCSGTSMASPHTAGAVVLLTEWWRGFHIGANPSPAMAKALLVNGAVDMGTADIPNANEGWGRINITNVITRPRPQAVLGPDDDLSRATGDNFHVTLGVPNPALPVKVTLAWTDAAGAAGANPALVNNLDLTVVDGANTYLGNRFTAGWSATGGTPDTLNNVENVFIQIPGGSIDITVAATAINGDGVPYNGDATDQDFALVCTNCALNPDFTLDAARRQPRRLRAGQRRLHGERRLDPELHRSGDPRGERQPGGHHGGLQHQPGDSAGSEHADHRRTPARRPPARYTIQVDGTSTTGTKSRTVGLDLFTAAPSAVTLLTPAAGASNQPVQPTFTWQAVAEGGTYTIEVASDAAFTSIVETASGITSPTYTLTGSLNTNTIYYWRVKAANACGTGVFSACAASPPCRPPAIAAPGTVAPVFSTDFEAGPPGWTHSGTGDSWALSGVRTHSGANAFHANDPAVGLRPVPGLARGDPTGRHARLWP